MLFLTIAGESSAADDRACDGSRVDVAGIAAPAPRDPAALHDRPTPLTVEVRLELTELSRIDELTGSFRFEGLGDFRFCDPGSAFDAVAAGRRTLRYSGVGTEVPSWAIGLHVANGIGPLEITQRLIEIDADGSTRIFGYFSSAVGASFDLRRFPIDRHVLEIQLGSFVYDSRSVALVIREGDVTLSKDVDLPEWRIGDFAARVEKAEVPHGRASLSRAIVTVEVDREWGFYLFKLWLPLSLIVAFSWSVFWMSDESLVNRIRVAATAFLTVVAYQFAVAGNLPKVAYLTLMDRLMILSFFLIALSALESMIVSVERERDSERALAWDRRARGLFPLAYVVGILFMAILYAR